ncbi:hypothetical protein EDF24_2542 [Curtobacterium sp. PhB130]|uniref:hypothetical protein n=1 Tax=unclassified Curtobacterium TaxID=257496 RepID=UPI000F4D07A6|nr:MULTISPECIES: hypothetical protein [unclassified Curtobacterium]ROS75101.1 hypothetical protein EDF24_2542 [Curtobacterium sp. PhB130]TCK63729.1 hypothetical protein EDF27_2275 [Curtobacterium sp. PhB136]
MGQGWKVDVAGAQSKIDDAAAAGTRMQRAAIDVEGALRDVVAALTGSDPVGAAQAFVSARQGDATAAVRTVERGIAAATGVMAAFAEADVTMADTATAAAPRAGSRGVPR